MNPRLKPYQTYGIALLRVSLGVYYILHGYYGFLVVGVERLAALNASMGIPLPTIGAWAVVLGHLFGGALLLLGFYARLGALVNAVIMAGAAALVHFDQGFFMHGLVTNPETGAAVERRIRILPFPPARHDRGTSPRRRTPLPRCPNESQTRPDRVRGG